MWLSRDPIAEAGGINLTSFGGANAVCFYDPYGLAWYDPYTDAIHGSLDKFHRWQQMDLARDTSMGNVIGHTILGVGAQVVSGIALAPVGLGEQIGVFAADPELETIPLIGPTGKHIGESTAALTYEGASAENVADVIGAYSEGILTVLSPVQAKRSYVKQQNRIRARQRLEETRRINGQSNIGEYFAKDAKIQARGAGKSTAGISTRLPRNKGRWTGDIGESRWYSELAEVNEVTGGNPVQFVKGRPVFSPFAKGRLKFKPGQLKGTRGDFDLVYEKLMRAKGLASKNQARIWLRQKDLTPHHFDDIVIELIPSKLHGNIPHIGSAHDLRMRALGL